MGVEGPNEDSRQLQPCVHRILATFASIILCCLFILLTSICNCTDQQSFFLASVVRIIYKAKWRVGATKHCTTRHNEPRTPSTLSRELILKQYVCCFIGSNKKLRSQESLCLAIWKKSRLATLIFQGPINVGIYCRNLLNLEPIALYQFQKSHLYTEPSQA